MKYNSDIKKEIDLLIKAKVDVVNAKRFLEAKFCIKLKYNDVYYTMI